MISRSLTRSSRCCQRPLGRSENRILGNRVLEGGLLLVHEPPICRLQVVSRVAFRTEVLVRQETSAVLIVRCRSSATRRTSATSGAGMVTLRRTGFAAERRGAVLVRVAIHSDHTVPPQWCTVDQTAGAALFTGRPPSRCANWRRSVGRPSPGAIAGKNKSYPYRFSRR